VTAPRLRHEPPAHPAPGWLLAATAPLRSTRDRRAFHWTRLAAYFLVVGFCSWGAVGLDPRPWVAVVLAACPATLLLPLLLLSVDGLARTSPRRRR
jgi:hypothetical protein